jgi:hypothetical protein
MLKFLDQNVFQIVNHFHQSHLNSIHDWHKLNQEHFHIHHFNQFRFRTMLKFLVQAVFHFVVHFHQSHSNQIHDIPELNQKHFEFITSIGFDSRQCWNFLRDRDSRRTKSEERRVLKTGRRWVNREKKRRG